MPAIRLVLRVLSMILMLAASAAGYEGFGAKATGAPDWARANPYRVTSCSTGTAPGTLRHAAAQATNRHIIATVACNPPANFQGGGAVYLQGSNVTLDFTTAPAPGFQMAGQLAIGGQRCSPACHNIIIKGLIYRGGPGVCTRPMNIEQGAHTIVVADSTFERCGNDCISINSSKSGGGFVDPPTRNITLERVFFNHPLRPQCSGDDPGELGAETALLIGSRARRITVKNCLFYDAKRRTPWARYDTSVNPPDTVVDVVNNLMYKVSGETTHSGPRLMDRVIANVRGNYIRAKNGLSTSAEKRGIVVCKSSGTAAEDAALCTSPVVPAKAVYLGGNIVRGDAPHEDLSKHAESKRTTATLQPVAPVTTTSACAAAQAIRNGKVGAPHKNAADRAALKDISLVGCDPPTPPPPPPVPPEVFRLMPVLVSTETVEDPTVTWKRLIAHEDQHAVTTEPHLYYQFWVGDSPQTLQRTGAPISAATIPATQVPGLVPEQYVAVSVISAEGESAVSQPVKYPASGEVTIYIELARTRP